MHICILKDEHREKAAFMVRNGLLREAFQGIVRENILGFFTFFPPQGQPLFISWVTLSLKRPTPGWAPTLETPC